MYDARLESLLQLVQMTAFALPSALDFLEQMAHVSLPKYEEIIVLLPDRVIGQW